MVRIFECLLRMRVWRPRWENHKFMGSLNLKMKTFPKQTKQKITVFSRENLSQTLFMLYYIFIDKTIKSLWGRQSSLKNNMYGLLRFFFILIVCICVYVYTHEWRCPWKTEKVFGPSGAGVAYTDAQHGHWVPNLGFLKSHNIFFCHLASPRCGNTYKQCFAVCPNCSNNHTWCCKWVPII